MLKKGEGADAQGVQTQLTNSSGKIRFLNTYWQQERGGAFYYLEGIVNGVSEIRRHKIGKTI